MQQASEMIRSSKGSSLATLDKRRVRGHQTPRLVQSAKSLLSDAQGPSALGAIDMVASSLESSAMCQWVADLTYRVVKCAHVGLAYVDEKTQTLKPLAHAGPARVSSARWWASLQSALFTEPSGQPTVARLAQDSAQDSIVVELPARRTARTERARTEHVVSVMPIGISKEIRAIFAVEPRTSPTFYPAETLPVLHAMASVAAATLQAQVYRRAQTPQTPQTTQTASTLNEALEEMDGALTLVSHELKSPLTTIMACLQLARPKVERLAQAAQTSPGSRKTAATIQDLLSLAARYANIENRVATDLVDASRIRSAQITLLPRPCDLGQIVREAVAGQRVVSPTRIIHLDVPDRSIPVSVDPDRVAQVVTNFLVNALKYSHKVQPVEVRVRAHKNRAQVSVRDYGPGLEKSELKRVWERFYRVSGIPTHSATGSGLGLGLYISREIIRGHGGTVGVTSVPSHGATFWFTLSLIPPASAAAASATHDAMSLATY